MRGHTSKKQITPNHQDLDSELSAQLSDQYSLNPHDQAFIIYSDEDVLSRSSHSYSHHSDSRSVSFSNHSHASHLSRHPKSQQENINILDQLANEESSIYDVRESECSESCKELLHTLEPLFNTKSFLRRSPRFATHNQPLYSGAIQFVQKPFKVKKVSPNLQVPSREMIEDEKCGMNQNTQILEEKQEQQMQLDNTTCNSSVIIPSMQKLIEGELQDQPQIFPCLRQTRTSLKINFECESTRSNTSHTMGRRSTSEYLSKATKEFILSLKKEKKIKKREKEKSTCQKTRQYNLRHH